MYKMIYIDYIDAFDKVVRCCNNHYHKGKSSIPEHKNNMNSNNGKMQKNCSLVNW